jgi:hypothetical protein
MMKTNIKTVLNIGRLSGFGISDFYTLCRKYDVEVVNCKDLGGLFIKSYHVELEGKALDLAKVSEFMRTM